MAKPADSVAAPIGPTAAAALLTVGIGAFAATLALASPDGAEWTTAAQPMGCLQCHLDSPALPQSEALTLDGLPRQPEPGKRYPLTIGIRDPALKNSGFLLSVQSADAPAGTLSSVDERTETNGAQARSNYDSSMTTTPGEASWQLIWTAPPVIAGPLRFDLWANAGNYDLSPLGDRLHHRIWTLPPDP